MGGCISNSFKLSGACSRKEDPNDHDPTYIRIFGFLTLLCAIIVLGVGSVQYIISVRIGYGVNLGNGFILPAGAFWGGIFSFIAGFLSMFHGFRQPFYNFNRPSGLYGAGSCYPCTCAKMASLIAFLAMLISIGATIWDIYCAAYYGLLLCIIGAVFNGVGAICCLIIWAATLTQFGPCCSCCFTEYDRRHEGYEMEARDFFSYKNTMSGFGGEGGAGLFGKPPPPPVKHNIRDQSFGPPAGTPLGPPIPVGPPVLATVLPTRVLPPIVVQQPGVPLHTTVHLGDHPAPVIGMGYGPSPMQYSMIQQQQHMGPGQMMAPGPGLAHRQGLMQGPGPGQMMATGPGPMQGPPYGMPQGQVVMGNMYMSQVPVRAGPYHQR